MDQRFHHSRVNDKELVLNAVNKNEHAACKQEVAERQGELAGTETFEEWELKNGREWSQPAVQSAVAVAT